MQNLITLTAAEIETDFVELGGSAMAFDDVVDGIEYTQDALESFEQAARGWNEYKSMKRTTSESGHPALVILGAQARKGDQRRNVIVIDYGTIRAFEK